MQIPEVTFRFLVCSNSGRYLLYTVVSGGEQITLLSPSHLRRAAMSYNGGSLGIRTLDPLIKSQLLCHIRMFFHISCHTFHFTAGNTQVKLTIICFCKLSQQVSGHDKFMQKQPETPFALCLIILMILFLFSIIELVRRCSFSLTFPVFGSTTYSCLTIWNELMISLNQLRRVSAKLCSSSTPVLSRSLIRDLSSSSAVLPWTGSMWSRNIRRA